MSFVLQLMPTDELRELVDDLRDPKTAGEYGDAQETASLLTDAASLLGKREFSEYCQQHESELSFVIYKYPFEIADGVVDVEVPYGFVPISVGHQPALGENMLALWAGGLDLPQDKFPKQKLPVVLLGTGHKIKIADFKDPGDGETGRMSRINTVQTPAGLVWHVFGGTAHD